MLYIGANMFWRIVIQGPLYFVAMRRKYLYLEFTPIFSGNFYFRKKIDCDWNVFQCFLKKSPDWLHF